MPIQRGGHTDDDGIRVFAMREITGRVEARFERRRDNGGWNVFDVSLTLFKALDF